MSSVYKFLPYQTYHQSFSLSSSLSVICASGCFLLLGQKTFPRWLKNFQAILLHDKSSDIGGSWCLFICLTMLSKAQILSFHSILFTSLAFWLHVGWLKHMQGGYHRSIYHICHQGRRSGGGERTVMAISNSFTRKNQSLSRLFPGGFLLFLIE